MNLIKGGASYGSNLSVTREIAIPATAGNVAWTQAAPAGKKWRFLRLKIVLVTDATVANRTIVCGVVNAAGTIAKESSTASANIAASLTRGYILHNTAVAAFTPSTGLDGVTYVATVNFDGYAAPTDLFKVVVLLGVAGDSYSGSLLVEETT